MRIIDLTDFSKIAVSGTHGIGKTTLVKRINEQWDIPIIPEFARDLINMTNFRWTNNNDIDKILSFEKAILYSHVFCVSTMPRFVADRSIFDIWSYVIYHQKRHPHNTQIRNLILEIESYFPFVNSYYDAILFYNKGYTQSLSEDQKEIHIILSSMLSYIKNTIDIPVILVNKGEQISIAPNKILNTNVSLLI